MGRPNKRSLGQRVLDKQRLSRRPGPPSEPSARAIEAPVVASERPAGPVEHTSHKPAPIAPPPPPRLDSLPPDTERSEPPFSAPGHAHDAPLPPSGRSEEPKTESAPPSSAKGNEAPDSGGAAPVSGNDKAPVSSSPVSGRTGAPQSTKSPAPSSAPTSDGEEAWPVGVPRPGASSRTWVWLLGAVAGAIGIFVGVKLSKANKPGPLPLAQTASATAIAKSAEPAAVTASAAPMAPPQTANLPPSVSASAAASASAAPAASAGGAAAGDSSSATALRDHALALLQEAKNPEAMAAARAALNADPTDAMPYLVLGSALQDTGKWLDAHKTYELCVRDAKKGMLDECRAMLRKK